MREKNHNGVQFPPRPSADIGQWTDDHGTTIISYKNVDMINGSTDKSHNPTGIFAVVLCFGLVFVFVFCLLLNCWPLPLPHCVCVVSNRHILCLAKTIKLTGPVFLLSDLFSKPKVKNSENKFEQPSAQDFRFILTSYSMPFVI